MLRTYVKRKKETAEEQFDRIFGRKPTLDSSEPKEKKDAKRRRYAATPQGDIGLEGRKKSPPIRDTASLKFDEIIHGKSTDTVHVKQAKDLPTSKSDVVPTAFSVESDRSKYDIMFEKNEKLASDKFDAMFTESEHISHPKKLPTQKNKWCTTDQSQVLDDLSSFNSWADDTDEKSVEDAPTSPTKSPTKLPSITHASMVSLAGRLVLNIQRGGESKSLIGDGGKLLVSPVKKNHSSFDNSTVENKVNGSSNSRTDSNYRENLSFDASQKSSGRKLLSSAKRKAMKSNVSYNSRPWAAPIKVPEHSFAEPTAIAPSSSQKQEKAVEDEFSFGSEAPVLKKTTTWPQTAGEKVVTSIKCRRDQRQYFTVVRHVKNYQNCLEEGEIQEFKDELQYLQEGLPSSQPVSTRCLSVTSLASKCESQNFRLYLRAHNVLGEVFQALQDADQNEAVAYGTSALLYMLSRDRQIDISKTMLSILLKLADPLEKSMKTTTTNAKEKDSKSATEGKKYSKLLLGRNKNTSDKDREMESVTIKIKDLIDRCGDPLVTSDNLSTKVLASEALLRYTARRTSDWYREEIRLKGGLDHVINLLKIQVVKIEDLPSDVKILQQQDFEKSLRTVERLLRVLENGIVNSQRNATYLVTHQRALLLKKMSILMSKCFEWITQALNVQPREGDEETENKTNPVVKNVIVQMLKLLVNISNDSEWASTRIGEQDGFMHKLLFYILRIPKNVDENDRYEIMLLSLGLLINLVESSAQNRMAIMRIKLSDHHSKGENDVAATPAIEGLVKLFLDCEVAARENEILGEDGVKKAAEKKQNRRTSLDGYNSLPGGMANDDEGYWVESEEGMEWVSSKSDRKDDDDDLLNSQSSHHSISDPKNIEAKLTPEQKEEMKQALEKANDHMEASIIASYTSLVLGCLIHGNRSNTNNIRSRLPNDGDFAPMITMLKKFLSFMKLTHGMSKKGEQKLMQVIEELEEINLNKFQPPKV